MLILENFDVAKNYGEGVLNQTPHIARSPNLSTPPFVLPIYPVIHLGTIPISGSQRRGSTLSPPMIGIFMAKILWPSMVLSYG